MKWCDEERTFLVRVRPGGVEAEVLFLNTLREGWEGPFDLRTPLQSILEYDVLRVPSKTEVRNERASPDSGDEGSEKGENKCDEKTPPVKIGKAGNSPLERHLGARRSQGGWFRRDHGIGSRLEEKTRRRKLWSPCRLSPGLTCSRSSRLES